MFYFSPKVLGVLSLQENLDDPRNKREEEREWERQRERMKRIDIITEGHLVQRDVFKAILATF